GKILVFAGTSEGRKLVESISNNIEVVCCVATEYGKNLLPKEREGLTILQGRMTINDMGSLMAKEKFDLVIDTTHPYASIVTENIK
ncbi:precorrin-6A/cobalt-precorrin-6A reductase, partial [Acinetobacter baumannii]|nr:precorrin-6A/cobalt-precorrin-6A reductase [Acinetobacter baumannii]